MSYDTIKENIPSMNEILNKLYIISGAHETNSYDKVNITSRFKICPSDGLSFHLGRKIGYLTNRCTGLDQEALREPACTYGKFLQFTGPTLKDEGIMSSKRYISFDNFWSNFFKFIKTMHHAIKLSSAQEQVPAKKKISFFLATHHNRLKKTIFEAILDKTNRINFANCCCIKISIINNVVSIVCLHGGYPDKHGQRYTTVGEIDENGANNYGFLNHKIKHFKSWIILPNNLGSENIDIDIYIIRHGNAFHNAPLKLGNKNYFKRPLDSCLTPLGIYQAHDLANFLYKEGHLDNENTSLIFCSSYMNRAQLTITEIAAKQGNKRFNIFKMLMRKMSMARLYRTLGANITKWKEKMKILSEHFSSNNLPGNAKKTYDQLITISENVDEYYNSCEKFMHLPTVRIPAEGTLLFQPPYSSDSLKIDFYTNLMKLSRYEILKGGKRRTNQTKKKLKCTKKRYKRKKLAHKKRRTKKIALKKKH